ncbi:hypothetical protein RUND412_006284 [Rhizina undulata]
MPPDPVHKALFPNVRLHPEIEWSQYDMDSLDHFEKYLISDEPWSPVKARHLARKRDEAERRAEFGQSSIVATPRPENDFHPDTKWKPLNMDDLDDFEKYLLSDEPWSLKKAQYLARKRNEAEKRAEAGQTSIIDNTGHRKAGLFATVPITVDVVKPKFGQRELTVNQLRSVFPNNWKDAPKDAYNSRASGARPKSVQFSSTVTTNATMSPIFENVGTNGNKIQPIGNRTTVFGSQFKSISSNSLFKSSNSN